MTRHASSSRWKRFLLPGFLLAGLLLGACERIQPSTSGSLSGDEVLVSCESCHSTRSWLQRLAVAEVEESSGGG
ncbi:MAG: hypothetical protein KC518_04920 [Candidatus Cloacimonetes bacterium]|nr:hypothetical protein [Candidatus Cloacimonadota bacterium]MCA9786427.1 hypothetical protein [Candidatus Cloacimonadota bacterium]